MGAVAREPEVRFIVGYRAAWRRVSRGSIGISPPHLLQGWFTSRTFSVQYSSGNQHSYLNVPVKVAYFPSCSPSSIGAITRNRPQSFQTFNHSHPTTTPNYKGIVRFQLQDSAEVPNHNSVHKVGVSSV